MFFSFLRILSIFFFFFFNDTATTEIYTFPYTTLFRSLLDDPAAGMNPVETHEMTELIGRLRSEAGYTILVIDRKSTRLNSSHLVISYAVFCLKKKKKWIRVYCLYAEYQHISTI